MQLLGDFGKPFSLTAAIFLLLNASFSHADDGSTPWSQWRGPQRNGIAADTNLNCDWGADGPKIAWTKNVGTGFAAVVSDDKRVFTVGNVDNQDTVVCLSIQDGKPVWHHTFDSPLDDRFFEGGPTATPTIDGDRVYVLSRQGDLFCFERTTGKINWQKNLIDETNIRAPGWGFAGSPVLHQDLLLLNVGEAGLAMDKMTGAVRWTSADREAGYATPLPLLWKDRWIAIIPSSRAIVAVDCANGKKLWSHRWVTRYGCNAADPIFHDGRVFISSGYQRGAALLELTDGPPNVVWANKDMQNQMHSSVLIDQHLYGVHGNSGAPTSLRCVEWKTGQVAWKTKWKGLGGVTAADGKLILLNEEGELVIVAPRADRYQELARASIVDGKCWTVPVLSQGRVYCRNAQGDVACVDLRE